MEKVKLTRSSGNVFRDLGFSGDEAEYLKVRAELMVNLQKVITARGLKQAEAAKLFGATDEEIQEAVHYAKCSLGWSAYLNGIREDYDNFATELAQIGEYMSSQA